MNDSNSLELRIAFHNSVSILPKRRRLNGAFAPYLKRRWVRKADHFHSKAARRPNCMKLATRAAAGVPMFMRQSLAPAILCVVCLVLTVGAAIAVECQQENFGNWLEHFKQEATGLGISQQTIVSALNGITYDPAIIARDHSQSVFQQSFEQFSGRMVSPDRLRKGANMLKRYGSILERIEDRYGVPAEVLVAGDLRATTELTRVSIQLSGRSQHWLMIVGAPKNFGLNYSTRFASSSAAT
jgi:hypothetical protein